MSIHYPGIQSLEFLFENCDNAYIRVSFIGLFAINNIQLSLRKQLCRNTKNCQIDYYKTCDSFMISLYRTYNDCWKNGGGKEFNHYNDLFERLHHNDIVSLKVKKSNDITESIYLPWHKSNDYSNKYQKTILNESGDIFIFVSKDENEFVDELEMIKEPDYANDIFSINELEEYSKNFLKR